MAPLESAGNKRCQKAWKEAGWKDEERKILNKRM